jgi:ABC-2 type transport system permease protein
MFRDFKTTLEHGFRIGVKDLQVFGRDRMMLISFVIMPIFMMLMMGFVFPSQNFLKNAPLGVVNLDDGPLGAQVISTLQQISREQSDRMFAITYLRSKGVALEDIKSQVVNGAVIVPSDFSAKVAAGEQASVILITDQSSPQVSAAIEGELRQLIAIMSAEKAVSSVASLAPGISHPETVVAPFTVETQAIVPGNPSYFEFVAPGLMAMNIMMSALIGLAGSISRERELGTMDGLLAAPISRLAIVVGKGLAQTVRGLLQAGITLILAVVFFGVVVHGSFGLLALLLLLTVFSFIGIGMTISALASQQETATTVMMTLTFPMLFLSGALFPIQQMPTFMQAISKAIPLSYAVEALRKCIVLGTGISGMMTEVWVMLAFGVVFVAISIPVFTRALTR